MTYSPAGFAAGNDNKLDGEIEQVYLAHLVTSVMELASVISFIITCPTTTGTYQMINGIKLQRSCSFHGNLSWDRIKHHGLACGF